MSKKKKDIIIQPTPDDICDDQSLRSDIIRHVNVFGFCDVIPNVVEAYRSKARRFNKEADLLEKTFRKVR